MELTIIKENSSESHLHLDLHASPALLQPNPHLLAMPLVVVLVPVLLQVAVGDGFERLV